VTSGRVVTVVLGSVLVAAALGAVIGGTALLLADRAGRDADGFLDTLASGPGTQRLTWTASEGRWAIVVMNADGSRPVTAAVSAPVTAPALHWVWTGLFLGAGLALIPGLVLIGLALPRTPRDTPTAPLVAV
jgi:hypothetical protein